MERILGLDVGDRYIGVAVSDLLGLTAQGVKTITRVNMNGSLGPQSEKTMEFGKKIKNKFKIEVIYIDERMTTMSAERILIEGNVRRENRKQYIDKIAASFILQSYLDNLQRRS